jgi:ABC-2 type transport system ATP-binding protein
VNSLDLLPAIEATRLSKRYGSTVALEDLTLQVRSGEVFCLLGPNGSGKTTFLRILTGFLSPSSGRVTVAGHDTVREPMAARSKVGYVPESVPLYRHMRVRELLRFMARLRHVPAGDVPGALDRVAGQLALGEVMDKPIATLSRGYRQRVALAQALIHDPEILVLDEPTNGLDPRQIIEVRGLIHALAGRQTILMSSHILGEVEKTAHRVAVLLRGRLLGVRDVADTPDLERWFLSLT